MVIIYYSIHYSRNAWRKVNYPTGRERRGKSDEMAVMDIQQIIILYTVGAWSCTMIYAYIGTRFRDITHVNLVIDIIYLLYRRNCVQSFHFFHPIYIIIISCTALVTLSTKIVYPYNIIHDTIIIIINRLTYFPW